MNSDLERAGFKAKALGRTLQSKSRTDIITMQRSIKPATAPQPAMANRLQTVINENDLLIANTHALQELVERILSDKTRNNANGTEASDHDYGLSKELEHLVAHLHRTQEKLEEALNSNLDLVIKLDEKDLRITNLLKRIPGQWEADSCDIKTVAKPGAAAIKWDFRNVYVAGTCYAELEFETSFNEEGTTIKLIKNKSQLERETARKTDCESSAAADGIMIAPTLGNAYEGSNSTISELSTSNWILIISLVSALIDFASSTAANIPKLISRPASVKSLKALHDSLNSWVPILRYDCFSAVEQLSRPHYAGLSITFENLSQHHRRWPYLNFIFSTIDAGDTDFGANPRLEFPEHGASHAMSSWYAEKDDEEGKRLELRFANPNNMDMQVWRSLSEEDQLLVAGILVRLPSILSQNEEAFITSKYSRAQWVELTQQVKKNFTKNIA